MTYAEARGQAQDLDAQDPLRKFRSEFVITDPEVVYLDGNSLGRLPKRAAIDAARTVELEWGDRLIRGWNDSWISLPNRLGGLVADLVGATHDEVLVCDSTSVNLYKLATAAVRHQATRSAILSDSTNFPSDLYVLRGIADANSLELRVVEPGQLLASLAPDVALLALSHTAFKSGEVYDMDAVTRAAHECGALVLWDLSHSAGAMPVALNACGVDLAVGCGYKYLNGGPGAAAFLFVRKELQPVLRNPIQGWMGQAQAFEFGLEYQPAQGIQRWATGTPAILSMAAMAAGLELMREAGIEQVRRKSVGMTEFLIECVDGLLGDYGLAVASPRDPARRGSHVSLGHLEAWPICQALVHSARVIPDFRTPDNIRFGVAPLYNSYAEIVTAIERLRDVMASREFDNFRTTAAKVT